MQCTHFKNSNNINKKCVRYFFKREKQRERERGKEEEEEMEKKGREEGKGKKKEGGQEDARGERHKACYISDV